MELTKPSKSAPILKIWGIPRSESVLADRHGVVALRSYRKNIEVVEGRMQFTGCSHGRGGYHTSYSWQHRHALFGSREQAEVFVEEHFPRRWDAEKDLEKLRAKRGQEPDEPDEPEVTRVTSAPADAHPASESFGPGRHEEAGRKFSPLGHQRPTPPEEDWALQSVPIGRPVAESVYERLKGIDPNLGRFPEELAVTLSIVTLRNVINTLAVIEDMGFNRLGHARYDNVRDTRAALAKLIPEPDET